MMKVFLKFLVFVMALLRLIGITGTYTILDESHTDYEGVYITIESIENGKNSHEIKVVWHNETENYISFGLGYTIEYLYGEQWVDVQIDDFAIPEIACSVEGGKTGAQTYLTKHFNMLRSGTYRILTEFYVPEENIGAQSTYALFEVKY